MSPRMCARRRGMAAPSIRPRRSPMALLMGRLTVADRGRRRLVFGGLQRRASPGLKSGGVSRSTEPQALLRYAGSITVRRLYYGIRNPIFPRWGPPTAEYPPLRGVAPRGMLPLESPALRSLNARCVLASLVCRRHGVTRCRDQAASVGCARVAPRTRTWTLTGTRRMRWCSVSRSRARSRCDAVSFGCGMEPGLRGQVDGPPSAPVAGAPAR